jgi:hypothetical protein
MCRVYSVTLSRVSWALAPPYRWRYLMTRRSHNHTLTDTGICDHGVCVRARRIAWAPPLRPPQRSPSCRALGTRSWHGDPLMVIASLHLFHTYHLRWRTRTSSIHAAITWDKLDMTLAYPTPCVHATNWSSWHSGSMQLYHSRHTRRTQHRIYSLNSHITSYILMHTYMIMTTIEERTVYSLTLNSANIMYWSIATYANITYWSTVRHHTYENV